MKAMIRSFVVVLLACQLAPAQAPGRPRGGGGGGMGSPIPGMLQFNGAIGKLFGEHTAFVTSMELEVWM